MNYFKWFAVFLISRLGWLKSIFEPVITEEKLHFSFKGEALERLRKLSFDSGSASELECIKKYLSTYELLLTRCNRDGIIFLDSGAVNIQAKRGMWLIKGGKDQ